MASNVQYFILRAVVLFLFVISLIVVLFLANGYKYDFVSNQIRRTGIIDVGFEDKQAQVYLDGQKLEGSLPFVASNVLPGKYDLVVAREGFWDWSQQISVQENIISKVEGILLYPLDENSISKTLLVQTAENKWLEEDYYFQLEGKQLAFVKLGPTLTEDKFVKIDLPNEKLQLIDVILTKAILNFADGKRYLLDLVSGDLQPVNSSKNLVFAFDKWIYFKGNLLAVFDLDLNKVQFSKEFSKTELPQGEIADVQYDDLNGMSIVAVKFKGQNDATLYRYSNQNLVKIIDKVIGKPFVDEVNNIIVLSAGGELWSMDLSNNKQWLLARFADIKALEAVVYNANKNSGQLIWKDAKGKWNIGDKGLSNARPMFEGKDIVDQDVRQGGDVYYLEKINSENADDQLKEKPEGISGSRVVLKEMFLDI